MTNWLNLRDYQLEAVSKMKNGCILCGDVGSGKSKTALAYYYQLQGGNLYSDDIADQLMDDPPRDLYIITTARKRDAFEWDSELASFLLTTNKELATYANTVVIDSWNNIKKYKNVYGAFFIFDEQRLVGSGAWVKAFYNIARKNQWILLSATPGDTWSDYIPVFVANGFYKNKTEFVTEHAVYSRVTKFPKIDKYIGTNKLNRLRNSILVNMEFIRPTVSHHIDIWTTYPTERYRDISRNRWNVYTNLPIETASEYCQTLRRVVNEDPSKQIALIDIFQQHPKLIVFYNYNYELAILKSLNFGPNVKVAEWNGQRHDPLPEGRSWVYLVQYNAGAEGWNCVTTDTMVFYSPNYSYRIMKQASGRIDRMNTPYTDLYYYHLKTKSSIDVMIARAIAEKRKFNESGFYARG